MSTGIRHYGLPYKANPTTINKSMLMSYGRDLRTNILTRDRRDLDVLSKSQSRTEHVKRGQRGESVKCDLCAGASYRV